MHDGNEDFDINYEEKDYLDINRIEFHKNFEKALINESDIGTLGLVKSNGKYIDSLFEKKINSIINLKHNIFMASGSGFILVFMLNNNCFKCLMEKYIPDDDLFSLCDLRGNNLIASGGNNLKIFKINYEINFLTLVETFNNNKKINKIILLEPKTPGDSKKMAVCDQNGYIGIYDIIDNEIVLYFNKKCHNSYINCILYLPEDEMLDSGSNGGGILKFWEIGDKCLKLLDSKKIPSTIYNGSLLDIKGYLLVGEKNGIRVFQHENRMILNTYFFKNEEFGRVYVMKNIHDDYFICGRSFGFFSIFLRRDSCIRKINIFRNNNLKCSEDKYDVNDDNFYITDICCVKGESDNEGYILISSADKTLKVYTYEIATK